MANDNEPLAIRWENDTRFYRVWLHMDLFGGWTLTMAWGSKVTRIGNHKTLSLATYEDGLKQIADIDRLRQRHGYRRMDEREQ